MPPSPRLLATGARRAFPWLKAGAGSLAGAAGVDLLMRGRESAVGTVATGAQSTLEGAGSLLHGAGQGVERAGEGLKWGALAAVAVGALLLVALLRGKL